MNPAGNAMMMWNQTTHQGVYNYTRMYVPGTGWQESIRVSEDIYTLYESAISANGNAIYLYQPGDTNMLYAKVYEAATGWGVGEQIDLGTETFFGIPEVVIDPNGNATVVWFENDGVQRKIYARHFDVDTGWGAAHEIGNIAEINVGLHIAMESNGNVITVWNLNGSGTEPDKIYTNTYEVWPLVGVRLKSYGPVLLQDILPI